MRAALAALVCGLLCLIGAPLASASPASPVEFAKRVEIPGGRKVFVECRGEGGPTVILVSAGGTAGNVWSTTEPGVQGEPVMPAVARFTRVCTYDRPGTVQTDERPGRSDPVALPRTLAAMAAELHAVLKAAHVPGPYVLAGHSLGGMLSRLYAGLYPGQVVGFVSIDAASEWFYDTYQELIPPALYEVPGAEVAVPAADREMRRMGVEHPLQPMPMIVVEHSRDFRRVPDAFGFPPELPLEQIQREFQATQDRIAALLPDTLHWIAWDSPHYIMLTQPGLIVRAIRHILGELRPVTVRCKGGSNACRAQVDLGGGASNKRVTVKLSDTDLRLVSVRPDSASVRGSYGLADQRLGEGGSLFTFTLDAPQTIPGKSRLILTFRAIAAKSS